MENNILREYKFLIKYVELLVYCFILNCWFCVLGSKKFCILVLVWILFVRILVYKIYNNGDKGLFCWIFFLRGIWVVKKLLISICIVVFWYKIEI